MIKRSLKKLYKDKRGSAMVMVIVAVAFVGILVATLMWVSMSNYFMKYTDARNKETFYSAETIFEEMKAGMQNQASQALIEVYAESFGDYTNGTSEEDLQNKYLNKIYEYYRDGTDLNHFDPDKLVAYVESKFNPFVAASKDASYSGTLHPSIDGLYETAVYVPKTPGIVNIQKTDTEVVLKNITVQFYDHNTGFYSEITSDLAVGLPNVRFTKASELPAIFDYSIIADQGLAIDNNVTLVSKKNIYAGEDGISIGQGNEAGAGAGSAKLDLTDVEYAVTRGTVSFNGKQTSAIAGLVTGDKTRLYAHDIDMSYGSGDLKGRIYVANDLTYKAAGDVKVTGDYFGFGNSTVSANDSSAILINSKNADLDLNGANSVLLAGHAFVGTSDDEERQVSGNTGMVTLSKNSADVLMDQSISVKGDQVAYLIPGTCIGIWRYSNTGALGETLVGMNPVPGITVSINETTGLSEPNFYTSRFLPEGFDVTGGKIETVAFDVPIQALGGKTLADYSTDYKVIYKNQYGQLLAYFYLVMSEDKAKEYFADYYGSDTPGLKKDNVDAYYRYYLTDSYIDESVSSGNVGAAGHYLSGVSTNNLKLSGATTSSADLSQDSLDMKATYDSLCAKLVTDTSSVSAGEISKTVYENLINEDNMPTGSEEIIFSTGSGDDEVQAVITAKDYVYSAANDKVHLIISAGDVTVEADFSGVIIAKGKVRIADTGGADNTVQVTENRDAVIRALQAIDHTGSTPKSGVTKPLDYLKDGTEYILEGTAVSSNSIKSEDQNINFGELVRYENWTKK